MNKQELDELKNECNNLANKLKELNEEELKEVVGGSFVFPSLLPYEFDQKDLFKSTPPDDLGLIDKRPAGNAEIHELKVECSVDSHIDYSETKWTPLFK